MRADSTLTALFRRSDAGDPRAREDLLSAVYRELRTIAGRYLSRERAGHTLSPTALVHEAWMRLSDVSLTAEDRREFFGIAARRMRQVLVDHARHRDAGKRGGGMIPESVTLSSMRGESDVGIDALALEQALAQLETADARKVRVVELRYFAGLEMVDIAEILGISRATAQRDWEVARTYLYQALNA